MDDKLKDKVGIEEAEVGTQPLNAEGSAEGIQESLNESSKESLKERSSDILNESSSESSGEGHVPVQGPVKVQEEKDKAEKSKTGDDSTRDDSTGDDSTGEDSTGEDSTGDDSTREDSSRDDSSRDDSTGDSTRDDSTGEDKAGDITAKGQQARKESGGPDHVQLHERQPEAGLEFVSGPDIPVKKKKRWKLALGIVFIVLFLAAGGAYGAGIYYFQDKFLPNTTINGIDASYAMPADIEAQIAAKVKEYQLEVEFRGGKKETLTSGQLGYHYVSKGEVEGFKKGQNLYKWPFSFWDSFTYTFESSTSYEKEQFNQAIENLNGLQPENMPEPKDAYMEFDTKDFEYVIVPEEQGARMDIAKVKEVIGDTVTKSQENISLEESGCYLKPAVTSDDKAMNSLVTKLNKYCHTRIEYVFGQNREVLEGSVINSWVSYDDKGNVTLDEGQIAVFVQGLAEKYNTYDKPREFRANDGSYVTVSGGSYGWMIDQEVEIQELTALIQSGAQSERYAAFAQTALSWENSDLGWDYIEIDLTKQHIWMYIGGEVVAESDFVSGDIRSSDKATPAGTYTLYYKQSPAVLKSDKPGDSYNTPVTFWMPFNNGVGLHDATWRSSFGGNIYTYDGSHGCVNLPYDVASQIYNMIYDGIPIICFYR